MSLRHPSARIWAEQHSASDTPRLGLLEAYALQGHPGALALAGDDGASLAAIAAPRRPGAAARGLGGWMAGLALVAVVLAPLIGMASLLGDPVGIWRMPIAESAPIAGVCFAIGAIVQLAVLGTWLARARPRMPLWIWVAIATAVLGAIALWFGTGLAQSSGFAAWASWSIPIAAAALIAAVTGTLQLLLSRGGAMAAIPALQSDRGQGTGSLRDELAAMAPGERQAVLADRNAALAVLEERGMLSPESAERARRAPLGSLRELDGR
ncbi:hypothetical protein [Agrococcus sp. Ld7]|uniref:hypothetical protein n=1 Tax=Agrococcus sp. Ld7 TaxID=649148 RepID=UPI00386C9CA4